jgi:hypothetical protein
MCQNPVGNFSVDFLRKQLIGEDKTNLLNSAPWTRGSKRVLLIAAAILAARKLARSPVPMLSRTSVGAKAPEGDSQASLTNLRHSAYYNGVDPSADFVPCIVAFENKVRPYADCAA